MLFKKYGILGVVIVAVVVGGVYYFQNKNNTEYEHVTIERNNLVQEVSVIGKVEPASKVDLAFESTGKVANVYVEIGDIVYVWQRLADLNSAQYQAQRNQAQANLEAEQSRLDELKRGTRPEEILIQEVKVQNAEQSLKDAQNNLIDKIKDAYTRSDDAVRNKADQLFSNPLIIPDLIFDVETSLEIMVETGRSEIEEIISSWNTGSVVLDNLSESSILAKSNLGEIDSFLDKLALVVNSLSASAEFSQTTIDGYKADINTARTNINVAIGNLSSADEKLRAAEASLLLEKQKLVLEKAGATAEQIKGQEAKVKSAQANVDNYSALIAKGIIYSPIDGIVTKVGVEQGEIVQSNTPVISVISGAEFEIEANIPEADIAKVKVGNIAKVTLDAYEDDVLFEAKVTSIEPAETVIEGVSTYKTIFQFTEKDNRIKSGMTANIDIITDSREDVVSVPTRAIHTRDGGVKYVEVLEGNEIVEKVVETGMRSAEGFTEIVSGIEEGEKVITFRES